MGITSLAALQEYQRGEIVELPSFAEGQPFVARLRRPSMMVLVKSGKIPNSLITTATKLFNGKETMEETDTNALQNVLGVLDVICEATFVEPSWADMQAAGITLTDEQYLAVFSYTQKGVAALEPFRQKPKRSKPINNVKPVQPDPGRTAGD